MNSVSIIEQLIAHKNRALLDRYLENIWSGVWDSSGKVSYTQLRLYKTVDKIKTLTRMGVNFEDKHVIDLGCGDGTMLLYLEKYFGVHGLGVDISRNAMHKLQSSLVDGKDLRFMVGDCRDLSYIGSERFDIALSLGVVEHLPDYLLAIAEARRVLRSGGLLILIQPHLFSFGVIQKHYLRLTRKWQFGQQREFSCFAYKRMLLRLGFTDVRFLTKPPYSDMPVTRLFDTAVKFLLPFWGHYAFIVGRK